MRKKLLSKKNINTAERICMSAVILVSVSLMPQTAFATGLDQVMAGINAIKTLLLSVVSGAGVISVIFSAVKIYSAITAHETTQIPSAVIQLAASLFLAFITGFLALVGVS